MSKPTAKRQTSINPNRPNAIKNRRITQRNLTQKQVADEMNALFAAQGIDYSIDQKMLATLENGAKKLELPQGLALATVLDTFLAEFVDEKVLGLGSFEVKILDYQQGKDFDSDLLLHEKHERIGVYSMFPAYPYEFLSEAETQEELEVHQRRYAQIAEGTPTYEYYVIDSFLNFLFSPVSTHSIQQKLESLDKMLAVFDKSYGNRLHFFAGNVAWYPRGFSNMQVFRYENLLYMGLPMAHSVLVIKSPIVCHRIRQFFQSQSIYGMTEINDSVSLLKQAKAFLENYSFPTVEGIRAFYEAAPKSARCLMDKLLKRVLL